MVRSLYSDVGAVDFVEQFLRSKACFFTQNPSETSPVVTHYEIQN